MKYNELSLKEKIGQRFILGINDTNTEGLFDLIKRGYLGGVVLYKKNYSNYQEMISFVKKIKKANKDNKIPLFIAIDQEGGRVDRMPSEINNIKSIYDTSKCGSNLLTDNANMMGKMLRETGINMNFAPVLDIDSELKNKALYKRCFYGNSKEVYEFGKIYADCLIKNGIIPVVKHFPGHGITKHDSHYFVPYIFNYRKLESEHMAPFRDIIKDNIPAIMVGHMVVRKFTKSMPATMSNSFMNEYLRDKYKYDGLIITDEINMLKRNIIYKNIYLDKILKSISDIILVKVKNIAEGYKIISEYEKIVTNDATCMKKLDDSVKRIIRTKEKYKITDDINFNGVDVDEINKEINIINDKVRKMEV